MLVNFNDQVAFTGSISAPAVQNPIEDNSQQNNSLFEEYNAWQEQSNDNREAYYETLQDYKNEGTLTRANADKAESDYNEEQKKIGLEFDFMQGADVNDKEAYDAQTLKLAQGKVEAYDSDGDGKISSEEFIYGELNSNIEELKDYIQNGLISLEDANKFIAEAASLEMDLFHIIDREMGNSDNSIDAAEYQTYYQYLDAWDGINELTGILYNPNQDGKIIATAEEEFNEYRINNYEQGKNYGKIY